MLNTSRILDFAFWTLAVASAVTLLASCETFEAGSHVATTPNPATGGKAPLEYGLEGLGEAIASPFSYTAWAKIFAAIGAVVGGTYGAKKLLAARAERKEIAELEAADRAEFDERLLRAAEAIEAEEADLLPELPDDDDK